MKRNRSRTNLQAISDLAELADYSFAFAIRAIAAIGVADHLTEGPRHIDYLAQKTSCSRHGLIRVLRALVTKSVFTEDPAETFALTPLGNLLRTDHPLSMRYAFLLEPDVHVGARLEYSIRTGESSFNDLFGMDYFTWLAANDTHQERLQESQRALRRLELFAITRSYPWQEITSIVDIHGGDGSLLAALLQQYPSLHGTAFDLPQNVAATRKTVEWHGVTERSSIIAGNVLEDAVLRGADCYTVKRVLIDYSDKEAIVALSNIRDAMTSHSRLLIMEPMGNQSDQFGNSLDLQMLVLGLGRLRSADEFRELVAAAGLKNVKTQPIGLITIIEARIADD